MRYYNFFQNGKWFISNKNRISTPAKIVDKKINYNKKDSSYIMVFELFTGGKLTFFVNSYVYSEYFIGDKGIIIYSKDKLINFKKKY